MSTIHSFIVQARERGLNNQQITEKLVAAGWDEKEARDILSGVDLVAPSPDNLANAVDEPAPQTARTEKSLDSHDDKPLAVVERYTTRGIEYGIQFLALGIGAVSLGVILHDLANKSLDPGYNSGTYVAMAGAAALVSIPIFVILFLRLKRAEAATPAMRRDSSRRKWVQLSLLVSFLWGVWAIVRYLYDLLAGNVESTYQRYCTLQYPSDCSASIGDGTYTALQILHVAITLMIAGGIFAYYWIDEHKKDMS